MEWIPYHSAAEDAKVAEVQNANPNGPLDVARLVVFESRLGLSLPTEYRQFLLAHNGCELTPEEIIFPGQVEPFAIVGSVFGLHDGRQSLDRVFENVEGAIPAELLAFGEDVGGNILCIGIRGEYRGKVYFWDHHQSCPGEDLPGWDGLTLLAGSFDAFISHLGRAQPGV